jgi:two-component system response regulator YesN
MVSHLNPLEARQWLASVAKDFALMVRQGRTVEPMGVVTRVAECVNSIRGKRVTVSDVADAVYMSSSGLTKLFRREIGCTVAEFINKVRIDEAKRLLRDPQYSVTDVADEMGFNDPSNFCKVFKRLVGITPGEFRRRETGREHHEQLA